MEWTKNKEDIIRKKYNTFTATELAKLLNINRDAVRKKARRLGIKREPHFMRRWLVKHNKISKKEFKDKPFCWFISGFVAGEGTFTTTTYPTKSFFVFRIALVIDDIEILQDIKNFFGVGNIRTHPPRRANEKGGAIYYTGSIFTLVNVIVPFFDKFGFFNTRKQKQYTLWRNKLIKYYGSKWC